jgi:RNA polymerase sigma-70 factor, ECF subfamily
MAAGKVGASTGPGGVNIDRAFAELRPAMLALAYRITGSRADAEDIVQEAFIRLQDAEPAEAVRSLKAYLATITARLSLNRLRDARARRESYFGEWLPEPVSTAEEPAVRAEDVSFALLVLLERLNPVERVVFVLRSAFDLSFEEISPVVGRDHAACRKIYSRARAHVAAERPRFTVDRARHRALLQSFFAAARGQDMERLLSLLDEEAVLHTDGGGKAPATKKPVVGRSAIARFVIAVTQTVPPDATVEEVELNGEPALVVMRDAQVTAAVMIACDGERIYSVFAIANPDKLAAIEARRH